jgi:peptidoglycan/xylan/chitin deacetylase (PgdA/CDA1 family)
MFRLFMVSGYLCLLNLAFGVEQSTIYSFKQNADQKNVALTFDDGPHGTLTPKLLDILKEKQAKVTFFVMGIKAELHPEILKRATSEGHEIANHVWDHPVLSKLTHDKVRDQISRTNTAIKDAIGKLPTTMRPPYGNTNKKLNEYLTNTEKLDVIMWSLDTNDWKRPSSKEIVKRVMDKVKPGTVILCHDIHPGTIEAMPALIEALTQQGYSLRTVTELVEMQRQSATTGVRLLRGSE